MQVGKTPLRAIPSLRKLYGLPKLYIKDESANPTGTWKDRRSELIVKSAKAKGCHHLALISMGNSAYSLAHAVRYDGEIAKQTRIQVSAILPLNISPNIVREIERLGARTIRTDLSQPLSAHQVVHLTRRDSKDLPMIVTNHYHAAYSTLLDEIIEDLGPENPPDTVICPIGSGEAFNGLYEADIARQRALYADPIHIYGVNPYSRTSLADKLVGFEFSPYAQLWSILPGFKKRIIRINEDPIAPTHKIVTKHMLAEPSASIAFCGLSILKPNPDKTVVIINSGLGVGA
ncbi:PLP-dependent lyase/thiolase [Candidatus Peregrinibacteria bacterium]|nr:PLP-dependent lyase/thiolase [Candidatus Peregrinibacteria bacterium]